MAFLVAGEYIFGGRSATGDKVNREDLLDVITLTSPYDHPFLTMVQKGTASDVVHSWINEALTGTATGGGTQYGEGAAFSAAAIQVRTRLSNLCEIFRKDVQASNTQRAVRPAGVADEYLHQVNVAIKEVARDMELTLLQGNATSATGTTGATTYMRNIRGAITTNAFSTSSTAIGCTGVGFSTTSWALGEIMFNATLEQVYLQGGKVDTVFVNGSTKRQISRFTNLTAPTYGGTSITARNIAAESKTIVSAVDIFETDFGRVNIVLDRWVGTTEGGPGHGTVNPDNRAFFFQMDTWELSFLRPLKHVPLPPGGDAVRGMVLAELTLTHYAEQWNARIGNISTLLRQTSDSTVTA